MATVTIDAQRWERVAYAARMAAHYQLAALNPGDGDDVERDVAPVAPDPGLREALQTAIFNSLSITYDIAMDCDLVSCDPEAAATAVLSVLAERGMA